MSDLNTASAAEPRKIGTLKILSGPAGLLQLLPRATMDFEVTARQTTLEWTRPGAGVARIEGAQIESVQQHGQAFIVAVKPSGFGAKALTFGTTSDAEAVAWVQAIEEIEASAAAARPDTRDTDDTPAGAATPVKLTYTLGGSPITGFYPMGNAFAVLPYLCNFTNDALCGHPITLVCRFRKRSSPS